MILAMPNHPKKNRRLIILCVVPIILLAVIISANSIIRNIAIGQLRNVFVQSQVSVGGTSLLPHRQLSLNDIAIKRPGVYEIKVKAAVIQWDIFSIFKPYPLKVHLKGPWIHVNTPKQGIADFTRYLSLKQGGGMPLGRIEFSSLGLDLNTEDLKAKMDLSARVNIFAQSLDYLDLKIDNFTMLGVELKDALIKLPLGSESGDFTVKNIKYDKINLDEIKGKLKVEDKTLSLAKVSALLLDGNIQADLKLKADNIPYYWVSLQCLGLNIERLVRDLNLQDKFNMTGRLTGQLTFQGNGAKLEILNGGFSTLQPGGTLVIVDTSFLENMARSSNQPIDLLVESFKNYHYNNAVIQVGFEDGNIVLATNLDGHEGKRQLSVVIHDFNLGKGEQ